MEKIILIVHMLTASGIIGLILIQQGKGAEAGASFGGGASQTVFGSGGSGNFFTRTTAILATIFFVTSFSLAALSRQNSGVNVEDEGIPSLIQQPASDIPVATDVPADVSSLPTLGDSAVEDAAAKVNDEAAQALDTIKATADDAAVAVEAAVDSAASAVESTVEQNKPE